MDTTNKRNQAHLRQHHAPAFTMISPKHDKSRESPWLADTSAHACGRACSLRSIAAVLEAGARIFQRYGLLPPPRSNKR